jgi:hypothetical protein
MNGPHIRVVTGFQPGATASDALVAINDPWEVGMQIFDGRTGERSTRVRIFSGRATGAHGAQRARARLRRASSVTRPKGAPTKCRIWNRVSIPARH